MAARVAVVNDDPSFLELMGTILEDNGYDSLLLKENAGSVAALAVYAPDLIILDLFFGHEAVGWEILAGIRVHPVLATLPVVLCTVGKRTVGDRADELRAQNTWYLEKPFDLADMDALIRSLLAQSKTPPPA
jgi:DNA-binding response OmpR family regulator